MTSRSKTREQLEEIARNTPRIPSDTDMLNWLDKHGAENVRGTDYPQWRIEGDYDQSLRDAIRAAIVKPEVPA